MIDGTAIRFYINAALAFSFTMTIPINVMNRTQNYIGKSYFSNDAPSNFYVDEIKIYNRALIAQEVEFDYRSNSVLTSFCNF